MGIRGLTSLIKKYAPDAITTKSFTYFKGCIVAVDTSILLYKFRYSNNNPNSHVNGFLNKCLSYIKNGILPIFILDGKPPPEKENTIHKRNRQKEKIENRIKELKMTINSDNEKEIKNKIEKLNKQIITVNKNHHKESKELLMSLGFVVVSSPGEAEAICASLQKEGIVNFTYSDDMDVLPLGCNKVLRSNTKNNSFVVIDLEKLLEGMKLNFSEFIDLCILCGCDYCSTIPKMSSDKAYQLILEHRTIENILENNETYEIPTNFDYKAARKIFNKEEKVNIDKDPTAPPEINKEKLVSFLVKKNYKKKYIQNYIKKFSNARDINISRSVSESSLHSLDSYFE